MPAKTYNSKQVAVICGAFPIAGFGDGEFLSIEMNADQWELYMGVDGTGTRSHSNNYSAKIKITVAQSSDSNNVMQAFWNADRLSGSGIFPFMAKDNSGNSLWSAQSAWIMKQPVAKLSGKVEVREWTLETDSLIPFEGGN